MSRRVFLDVGAHNGQTLQEVTLPHYGFDSIYAFEPMPAQFEILADRFGAYPQVALINAGLSDQTGTVVIYGDNSRLEASIYPEKLDVDEDIATTCAVLSAAEFFRDNISDTDTVIVKLNCEGAEVPILSSLIDSGEIWQIANVMIDFDIRRVAGHEQEADAILARLADIGFTRYSLCEDVMGGAPTDTHQERIARWLGGVL